MPQPSLPAEQPVTESDRSSTSGTFDPSFIHALTGIAFDFLNSSLPWAEDTEAAKPDEGVPATKRAGPLDPLLGAQQRADLVSQLSIAERPFSAVQGSTGWLQQASSPMGASSSLASTRSFYELAQASPAAQGDTAFDVTAEQQTRQYLAGLSSSGDSTKMPFATGAKTWLEEATIAPGQPGSSTSISSLSEIPEGYSPSKAGVKGDQRFDQNAEELTRQYLESISSSPTALQLPFAVGDKSPGWLEAASTPMVSAPPCKFLYLFSGFIGLLLASPKRSSAKLRMEILDVVAIACIQAHAVLWMEST